MGGGLNESTYEGRGRERFTSLFFVPDFSLWLWGKNIYFSMSVYPKARINPKAKTSRMQTGILVFLPVLGQNSSVCGGLQRGVSSSTGEA